MTAYPTQSAQYLLDDCNLIARRHPGIAVSILVQHGCTMRDATLYITAKRRTWIRCLLQLVNARHVKR